MAEYIKKSTYNTGTTKTALGLGIAGTALGLLNGAGSVLNPLAPRGFVGGEAVGFVSEKEMRLYRELDAVQGDNVRLKSEKYADDRVTASLEPVYGMLNRQAQEIGALKAGLEMETERRACGDENILTYVKGNYIKAEKSINSRDINFHGCRPVIRPVGDCCDCD